jgi:hypothetical protein
MSAAASHTALIVGSAFVARDSIPSSSPAQSEPQSFRRTNRNGDRAISAY